MSHAPSQSPSPAPGVIRPYPLLPLGLLAAVAGALAVPKLFAAPYANPDSHAFEALARSLLSGHGMGYQEPMLPGLTLRAFRSPGYGAFLALALGAGGVPFALALQGALAGLTAALIGAIAARLANPRAGWIALVAALAWGFAWGFAGQLLTETLYAFEVALALWLALAAAPLGAEPQPATTDAVTPALRWPWVLALAITLALGLLTRPSGFALLGALLLCVLMARPVPRRALLAAIALALLLWSPWPARNARVLGAPVVALTSGGLNAWNGNTARPIGQGWTLMAAHVELGELGLDRMLWRLTFEEARAHPLAVARRLVHKALNYLGPPRPDREQAVHTLLWPLALMALALAWRASLGGGLSRAWPAFAWGALAWPAAVWLSHATLTTLTVVSDRYRFPTDALVLVLGAVGIEALLQRFGAARGAPTAIAIGAGGALLVSLLRTLF